MLPVLVAANRSFLTPENLIALIKHDCRKGGGGLLGERGLKLEFENPKGAP